MPEIFKFSLSDAGQNIPSEKPSFHSMPFSTPGLFNTLLKFKMLFLQLESLILSASRPPLLPSVHKGLSLGLDTFQFNSIFLVCLLISRMSQDEKVALQVTLMELGKDSIVNWNRIFQ